MESYHTWGNEASNDYHQEEIYDRHSNFAYNLSFGSNYPEQTPSVNCINYNVPRSVSGIPVEAYSYELPTDWNKTINTNSYGDTACYNSQSTNLDDLSDDSIIDLIDSLNSFDFQHIEDTIQQQHSLAEISSFSLWDIQCQLNDQDKEENVMEQSEDFRSHRLLPFKEEIEIEAFNDPAEKLSKKGRKWGKSRQVRKRRSIYLWEFLLELLGDSRFTNCIRWLSQQDGIFVMLDTGTLANLWGERKKRKNMTYEKMSRAMRYYYARKILERVPKQKLVYKFGVKAMKGFSKET